MADHCIGFVLDRSDRSFKAIPILVHVTPDLVFLRIRTTGPQTWFRLPQTDQFELRNVGPQPDAMGEHFIPQTRACAPDFRVVAEETANTEALPMARDWMDWWTKRPPNLDCRIQKGPSFLSFSPQFNDVQWCHVICQLCQLCQLCMSAISTWEFWQFPSSFQTGADGRPNLGGGSHWWHHELHPSPGDLRFFLGQKTGGKQMVT